MRRVLVQHQSLLLLLRLYPEEVCYEFIVKNYSSRTSLIGINESINSNQFMASGYMWMICFFPMGKTADVRYSGYISLESNVTHDVPCLIEILLDQSGKDKHQATLLEEKQESSMGKMLSAADQLGLERLKEIYESRIWERVSYESVVYLLHLAERCHATELKDTCLRFAAENQAAVLETNGGRLPGGSLPIIVFRGCWLHRDRETFLKDAFYL